MPSGKTIAITAAHVIASVGGIYSVEDQYRHKYTITGIWKSPLYDMGYVSITGWHGPTLTFSSQKVEVGMKLYNIGFPLGVEQPYLSEGYVASGKTGFKDGISTTNYMTVFLDSTSGDSGSPILDKNGHVLGLVDMESGEFQRLIFCLPAETVQKEIKSS
jgi:S1-C subfamily serine protease